MTSLKLSVTATVDKLVLKEIKIVLNPQITEEFCGNKRSLRNLAVSFQAYETVV